jgi:phage tail sheath protein FI
MAVQTSYPGVYVEERPSGVRTIVGVSTSVTAFVGVTARGQPATPIRIRNMQAYVRRFGPPLDENRPMGHAIGHFFANGGSEAIVVRVVRSDAGTARATLRNGAPADVLLLDAASPGAWATSAAATGPGLVAVVNHQESSNPADLFNLTLTLTGIDSATGARTVQAEERYADVSMSPAHPSYVKKALAASELATVPTASPAPGGTAKGSSTGGQPLGTQTTIAPENNTLRVALDFGPPVDIQIANGNNMSRANVLTAVQNALVAAGLDATKVVASLDSNRLMLESQLQGPNSAVVVTPAPNDASATLFMGRTFAGAEVSGAAGLRPVQQAWLFANGTEGATSVMPADVVPASGTGGIFALSSLRFPRFNILCLPGVTASATQELGRALDYCKEERAFLIVDTPSGWTTDPPALGSLPALGEYGAIYYPRLRQTEPRPGGATAVLDLPPSGAVAGVYARVDGSRGVWKAPAGLQDSGLVGFSDLSVATNDDVSALLNPKGVNVLRSFPGAGTVIWGARTLKGDDTQASEFKYVPVRRLTSYIASSLYLGTAFAVFEPNDPDLWAQLRLAVGTFMRGLFRQGAFQRSPQRTESDSFFVVCDETVNPQSEIDLGRVNIVVGFAPLKPAEFVIVTITQLSKLEA